MAGTYRVWDQNFNLITTSEARPTFVTYDVGGHRSCGLVTLEVHEAPRTIYTVDVTNTVQKGSWMKKKPE